jgi:uncharacterized protein (DUF4415 family)
MALTIRDDSVDEEDRFVTLGMDALGRLLVVVYTCRGNVLKDSSSPDQLRRENDDVTKASDEERNDFRRSKRGAILKTPPGKTRITTRIDQDILQWFSDQVHAAGGGNYQTLINSALREYVDRRSTA